MAAAGPSAGLAQDAGPIDKPAVKAPAPKAPVRIAQPAPAAKTAPVVPPAAQPDIVKSEPGVNPAGEFQPVVHARNAGVTVCNDTIVRQSSSMIDRPHTAVSSWASTNPNEHEFTSLLGMAYPSKVVASGAVVLMDAPVGPTRCEGASVQVFPTAQPCGTIQAGLIKDGSTIGNLQGMPLVQTKDGARTLLMAGNPSGCVLVSFRAWASPTNQN